MLSKLTKDDQAFIQGFTECNANIVERQTQRGQITLNRDKKNASMRRGNNRLTLWKTKEGPDASYPPAWPKHEQ